MLKTYSVLGLANLVFDLGPRPIGLAILHRAALRVGLPQRRLRDRPAVAGPFLEHEAFTFADAPSSDICSVAGFSGFGDAASPHPALGATTPPPPDLPPERTVALRKAMLDTFKDPEFLAEAAKQQLQVDKPRSGEQIQAQIARVYQMPASVAKRLRAIAQNF